MIRLIAQGMLTLALLFSAALGAIHAQPYDDNGLSAQLTPTDCGCFLGIHPGVTTRLQALVLLHMNSWVGVVTNDAQTIAWTWSDQTPAFLSGHAARLTLEQGIVSEISLQTSAQIADLAFAFGAPDAAYFFNWQVRDASTMVLNYFEERATYTRDHFEASTSTVCPLTHSRMWSLPVTIIFPAPSAHSQTMGVIRNAFVPINKACE
ncbi:MAG: hypothetical protein ABI700_13255 [Chloroflexota bacterium]